jgi:phage terminase Nu1 subunit (DNA packaging protein)
VSDPFSRTDTVQTDQKRLITRRQASEIIPVSNPTWWRWEQRGIVRPRRIGRRTFYDLDEIRALAEHGAQELE